MRRADPTRPSEHPALPSRRCRTAIDRAMAALARLGRKDDGAAAIEFGLLGSVLFLSVVAMADVGLAVSERIAMDHTVRSGAQHAMADLGESNVRTTIILAAEAQAFPICAGQNPAPGSFCPSVAVSCFCPNNSSTSCENPSECPVTYQKIYNLSATMKRESMLLPDMNFNVSLRVQTR